MQGLQTKPAANWVKGGLVGKFKAFYVAGWHKLQKPGNWAASIILIFEDLCGLKG